MMGLRIPKAHKAITEARQREHPSDVDLRHTIIGGAILGLFVLWVVSDVAYHLNDGNHEKTLQVTVSVSAAFMFLLYLVSKLCPLFPGRVRWVIFYLCAAAVVGYVVLILLVNSEMLPVSIVMWLYCAVIALVSLRQIRKRSWSGGGSRDA